MLPFFDDNWTPISVAHLFVAVTISAIVAGTWRWLETPLPEYFTMAGACFVGGFLGSTTVGFSVGMISLLMLLLVIPGDPRGPPIGFLLVILGFMLAAPMLLIAWLGSWARRILMQRRRIDG